MQRPTPSAADGDRDYSVAVLGDIHFDAEPESVYHSHYDESNRWAEIQHQEFRRNGEMWRGRCRDLLAASGELARTRPTRFVLQLGDLVQGDCDDPPTHTRMLENCVRMLRAAYPDGLPFLTVIGNHDFRGKGAREAYFDFILPFLSDQLGKPVAYPVFSFRIGPDRWVFCDFEKAPLDLVATEIDADPDARHVFLVTHGAFTMPDERSFRWRLGGRDPEGRALLYETLSRHRAVVLSGHSHATAYWRHENPHGGFAEANVNSVWSAPEIATAEPLVDDPAQYGSRWLPQFEGADRDDFLETLDFFRPGLREYFYNRAAGHYRLDVSDDAVSLSFYPGDARQPARVFRLFG